MNFLQAMTSLGPKTEARREDWYPGQYVSLHGSVLLIGGHAHQKRYIPSHKEILATDWVLRVLMPTVFGVDELSHDDECPLCESGTVEVVDGFVSCRGECGISLPFTEEG
jgi:predicted solute-binding protein